jgi:carboxymethylenebutenolidase
MCHAQGLDWVEADASMVESRDVHVRLSTGDEIPVTVTAAGSGSGPGVLIINDMFGQSRFYDRLAGLLAAQGFTVANPEFFFRVDPVEYFRVGEKGGKESIAHARSRRRHFDEPRAVADLDEVINWLREGLEVTGDRVGVIGFCMGGTFALNLAARRSDTVTVAYYPFPGGNGEQSARATPAPLDELDSLSGPILAFWGSGETIVDLDSVREFVTKLKDSHVEFRHRIYEGLNHAFMVTESEDAWDSWRRTTAFLASHLLDPSGT